MVRTCGRSSSSGRIDGRHNSGECHGPLRYWGADRWERPADWCVMLEGPVGWVGESKQGNKVYTAQSEIKEDRKKLKKIREKKEEVKEWGIPRANGPLLVTPRIANLTPPPKLALPEIWGHGPGYSPRGRLVGPKCALWLFCGQNWNGFFISLFKKNPPQILLFLGCLIQRKC